MVGDVEMFPGHIACDAESKSEIVVPVIQNGEVSFCLPLLFFLFLFRTVWLVGRRGVLFSLSSSPMVYKEESFLADFRGAFGGKKQVVAIIDVDCAVKDAFDDEDKKALEELAQLIAESCDF